MKKNNIFKLAVFFLTLIGFVSNSISQDDAGLYGAYADIGVGLRPLGMGGAYTALASDENAPRWNPALLDDVRDPVAGFTWTNQFSLVPYHYLTVAIPFGRKPSKPMGFGLGAYALSAGDDVYRETTIGVSIGINATRLKIPVESLRLGTTVKILMTSFGNNSDGDEDRVTGDAFGYAVDLGLHWAAAEKLAFSIVSRELLNNITWNSSSRPESYSEGTPTTLVLAGAYWLEMMTFAMEYQPGFVYDDVPDRFSFGMEGELWKILRPRFGFAKNLRSRASNQWITAGLGIDIRPKSFGPIRLIKFGYSHLFHEIEASPRVGLIIGW